MHALPCEAIFMGLYFGFLFSGVRTSVDNKKKEESPNSFKTNSLSIPQKVKSAYQQKGKR